MAAKGSIEVNREQCKGCEVCVVSCPAGVIALADAVNGKGYRYAFPYSAEKCTGCANCAIVCPDSVITVFKIKA